MEKLYGQRNGLKLSGLAMASQNQNWTWRCSFANCSHHKNYFQAMIFSLNKFTIISRHWYRSFCAYICRIHAKTGLRTLPLLGWTLIVALVDYFDSLTVVTESSVPAVVEFLNLSWVMFTYFLCFNRWFR